MCACLHIFILLHMILGWPKSSLKPKQTFWPIQYIVTHKSELFFPHLMTVFHQVQVLTDQKTHHYYFTTLKETNILPFKYDRPLFERHILIPEMLKWEKRKKKAPLINNDIWSASWRFFPSQFKEKSIFHESLKDIPFYQCTLAYLTSSFWWWFTYFQFFDVIKMLQWVP